MVSAPASRILRAVRFLAASTGPRLMVFCLLALWTVWSVLAQSGGLNDFRDAHLLHTYETAAVTTASQYGQVPLWSPWSCGGLYVQGNAQTRSATPLFLLSLLLGAKRAEPVIFFLFLVLGMEGFFRYARLRSRSALGAFLAAPFFAISGYFGVSWALGWVNFASFELLPWCLFGTALTLRGRPTGALLVAGAFALMLGFGGTYSVPHGFLFVTLETLGGLLFPPRGRRRLAILTSLGITALFTLGAVAFRLWPIVELLRSAPRIMAGQPGHTLAALANATFLMTSRVGDNRGIFFISPLVFLLAASALRSRRAWQPLLMTLTCAWLAAGYAASPSLFEALRVFPLFDAIRYPERFLVAGALFLATLGAVGFGVMEGWARHSRLAAWGAVALCGVAVAGWASQRHQFDFASRQVSLIPEPEQVEQPFAQARGNRWAQGFFLALNRGSIACGESFPVPMSPLLRGDLPQEEYLEDASAGEVKRREWTPQRLELDVRTVRPAFVRVNQNWHPGWKSSVGEVVSREGLLGVSLPAGTHHVTLRFLPRSSLGGALVSLLAWIGMGVMVWRARHPTPGSPRGTLALAAAPLAAWVLLGLVWREPPAPPVLTNANGMPLLVDALPPGAVPLHGGFELPVTLLGARMPERRDADGLLSFELYWKVDGHVPRAVGVLVHLEGPDGQYESADHEVLGGTYFFKNAPRGQLLRDAFSVNALHYRPGTWRIYAGLWNSRGDGARLGARDAEGKPWPDGRVLVGTFTLPP